MENNKGRNYTVKLTTTALMIALAMILDQIKLFSMPQGGSVTLFGTLPIIALGYLLGTRWGLLGGAVTGLLNLIFGGYVIHPVQMILDYVIAFAVMGLSGLVRNKRNGLTKGYLLGVACRYICAVLSGVIASQRAICSEFSADISALCSAESYSLQSTRLKTSTLLRGLCGTTSLILLWKG